MKHSSLVRLRLIPIVLVLENANSIVMALTRPSMRTKQSCPIRGWEVPVLTAVLGASLALPAFALDPFLYTNDYDDPLHPMCERHIQVLRDGVAFHYSGTAVGAVDDTARRGCSPSEIRMFGLRKGSFDGVILEDGRISAGDNIHEGVWEPASIATTGLGYENVDGIRWKDGNKWIVKRSTAKDLFGYFFLSYIAFSAVAGLTEFFKRFQKQQRQ